MSSTAVRMRVCDYFLYGRYATTLFASCINKIAWFMFGGDDGVELFARTGIPERISTSFLLKLRTFTDAWPTGLEILCNTKLSVWKIHVLYSYRSDIFSGALFISKYCVVGNYLLWHLFSWSQTRDSIVDEQLL